MIAPLKKSYDQPRQHIEKQRHYFADKFCLVEVMVFPIFMYGWESWTVKKTVCWGTDAFNCGVGEDSWESLGLQDQTNQSILKEISPEYLLEGLMLKLKLQYFGHLMGRADSLEKTLMLGETEGRRISGWQRMK